MLESEVVIPNAMHNEEKLETSPQNEDAKNYENCYDEAKEN